jgi:hypothetical protein
MNLTSPQFAGFMLCVGIALLPVASIAQNQAATPSRSPGAKPSPSISTPKYTNEQLQEMASKLQDRIHSATDQVMGRIQKQESDLYIRFSYFDKPNRLDPNTYGSQEDIAVWQKSLQQFRGVAETLQRLYADADQDLGNALVQQRINPALTEQIKNELLKTFPWERIRKKNQLIQEFIAEHEELLALYDKNWASRKPGPSPFEDQNLAATYQSLKEKITATGQQIEGEYKAMLQ